MEDQINIETPKDLIVKLQGLPIILKKGTKVFCRQSNFDFAMKEYEEWEKTKDALKISSPVELQVRQKTVDIGITEQPEKPEDMPKTITVLTHDFIQLIMIAGSLCHPEVKPIYKQKVEDDIRKIALRHHINYVGEIKEG